MASLRFLITFYTHPLVVGILAFTFLLACTLLVLYASSQRAILKRKTLLGLVSLSTFLWLFFILSILLCTYYEHEYLEYPLRIVKLIASISALAALTISLILAALVNRRTKQYFLRNAPLCSFTKRERALLAKICATRNLPPVTFKKIRKEFPNAYSLSGKQDIIFFTKGLLDNLGPRELEAVILHEYAHLANKDSTTRIYLAIMAKIIFFDPVLRYVHRTIGREMEFMADDYAVAKLHQKKALLSALRNINDYHLAHESFLPSLYSLKPEQVFLDERIARLANY
ncbi:hypothetical protein D6789_00135 [Candidatus Woesearchaeota archaeon]|nr:MAG: hypothetical protein D6789_00135 [Candidatus Woesearchaeota archaeon]